MASHEDLHDDMLPHFRTIDLNDLDPDLDKGKYQESLDVPYDSGAPTRHVRTKMHKIPEKNNEWAVPYQPSAETSLMSLDAIPSLGTRPVFYEQNAASKKFALPQEEVEAKSAFISTPMSGAAVTPTEEEASESEVKEAKALMVTPVNASSTTQFGSTFQGDAEDMEEDKETEDVVIRLSPIAIDHDLIDKEGSVIDVPFMDLFALVGQYMQKEGANSLVEAKTEVKQVSAKAKRTASGVSRSNSTTFATTAATATTLFPDDAASKKWGQPAQATTSTTTSAISTGKGFTFSFSAKAPAPIPVFPAIDPTVRTDKIPDTVPKKDSESGHNAVIDALFASIDAQEKAPREAALHSVATVGSDADSDTSLSEGKTKSKAKSRLRRSTRARSKL